jgi:hypothetical protein
MNRWTTAILYSDIIMSKKGSRAGAERSSTSSGRYEVFWGRERVGHTKLAT